MQPYPQDTADLVIFTEKILNGKLHFLCSVICQVAQLFRGTERCVKFLET